ncbi:E3 ubiquitin-protein ligase TRIM39-like [Gastrophryne carolinensis]
MASARVREELDCSICLQIFTDPVTLPCGHNFCSACINRYLDIQEPSRCYSCPECRYEFQSRPALQKNFTLVNIAKHLSEQSDKIVVSCTYCIESSAPAATTCLMCEASLCEKHLKVHSKSPEHILCKPTTSFDKVKCPTHGNMFVYYCPMDDMYLCPSCTIHDGHVNHQLELLKDFCDKKKEKMKHIYKGLKAEREYITKKIQDIKQPKQRLESKFAAIREKVSSIVKEIYSQLAEIEKVIRRQIGKHQKLALNVFTEQIDKLETKQQDLTRKMNHISELCSMTDPIAMLRDLDSSYGSDLKAKDEAELGAPDKTIPEDLDESPYLITLQQGFSDILNDMKRRFPIECAANVILDINTAANNVLISTDGKRASWQVNQGRPKVPERFQYHQVLSKEAFSSGRHYWDIETGSSGNWMVGVSYPSIPREESQAIIGKNDKSWSLCKWNNQYYALHDKKQTPLNIKFACRKFRICLDYGAGRVAFYELDNAIDAVHTFTISAFIEPLHAAGSFIDKASNSLTRLAEVKATRKQNFGDNHFSRTSSKGGSSKPFNTIDKFQKKNLLLSAVYVDLQKPALEIKADTVAVALMISSEAIVRKDTAR